MPKPPLVSVSLVRARSRVLRVSRLYRPALVLAALTMSACGWMADDADPSESAETLIPVVDSSSTTVRDPLVRVADDAVDDIEAIVDSLVPDSVAEGAGDVDVSDSVAPATATPTNPVAEQETTPTTQERSDLTSRLDAVLAGQEALVRRLESLEADVEQAAASSPAPAATTTPATGSGGQAIDPATGGEVLGEAGLRVRSFGRGIILSLIVLLVFNGVVRGSVWLLDALAERNASRRLFYKRLVPIVRIILWVFAAYLIVSVIFRVNAQGIFAAAAAIGVAIGFAAQDLLKNLFGGIILVFDQPFQVGDKISVDGTYGEVVSIGLRSTRIVTPDDNLVSVPNAQVVDQQVANANAGELNSQVVTDLYLPGWADEALAKRIAFDAATSSKYVYLKKPIVVLVSDVFKETFLTRVRVKAYVLDPRLEFMFQSDVTERARAGFREAGLLDVAHMERRFMEHAAPAVEQRREAAREEADDVGADSLHVTAESAGDDG